MPITDNKRLEIEQEHHEIRAVLRRLEAASGPATIASRLGQLAGLLESHFALEESSDGLHSSIGKAALHLLPKVEGLFSEHRQISSTIDRLRRQCTDHERMAEEIREGARALVRQLRDHEAEENAVLMQSVLDVHGAGD